LLENAGRRREFTGLGSGEWVKELESEKRSVGWMISGGDVTGGREEAPKHGNGVDLEMGVVDLWVVGW